MNDGPLAEAILKDVSAPLFGEWPERCRDGDIGMRCLRCQQSGQVLVLAAISMVVLVGFLALSVDVGLLWASKRQMQTAADAAAVAAAVALRSGHSYQTAATGASKLNGFTYGQNGVTVTVNNPPLSGTYAGNQNYVEVVVKQPQPAYFLGVLGYSTVDVSVRAVSGSINGPACVYALNPSASGALTINGNGTIAGGCGTIVDSNSSSAMIVNGNDTINMPIGVVGNYSDSGHSSFTPEPVTGVAPLSDPLASVPAPSVGACNYTNFKVNGNSNTTLSPGVYCDGITINGNANITFQPGTYILNGGGMTLNGNGNLAGAGVTFYDTKGYSSYQPIVFNGNGVVNLSAPTSGPLQGMLFFQDRSVSNAAGSIINGNLGSTFDGALYFPTTSLTYNGDSTPSSGYTIIVADTITLNGNVTMLINDNYSSLSNGSPIKSGALYE